MLHYVIFMNVNLNTKKIKIKKYYFLMVYPYALSFVQKKFIRFFSPDSYYLTARVEIVECEYPLIPSS